MTNLNSFFKTLLTNVNNNFKNNPVLRFSLYVYAIIISVLVFVYMMSSCSSVRTMIKSDGTTTVTTGVSQSVDSMSISLHLNHNQK